MPKARSIPFVSLVHLCMSHCKCRKLYFTSVRENLGSGISSSPRVIVIGSGIAGLGAAWALRNSASQVTVLESRDRIGGRIYTDNSFGFPVDMGASWLHGAGKDNPLASIIGELRLPLYKTSGDHSPLYDHDLESYALFDMDGDQVPADLVTQVGESFEALLKEAKILRNKLKEDISVCKALNQVLKSRPDLRLQGLAQKVLQWYLCRMEGWFAADVDNISVQCWDEEELLEGGHGLMVEGYAPLIYALAEGLDIRLNCRVTKVSRLRQGVQVITEDGKVFNADAAIVTVPLGVLKANLIKFEPRLPEWKEATIANMGIGNENKIALHFERVFWPNVDFLGIVAPTSYGCSYFLNLYKVIGHPVLVYMPSGRLATDVEKMSDEAAVNYTLTLLRKILPGVSEPLQHRVSRWGIDANTLGCYSYCAVGKPQNLYERMRVPVDNLFFAGEATSVNYPGTVHGAFSTGLMAAEECRRRCARQLGELTLFQPAVGKHSETIPLQMSRL